MELSNFVISDLLVFLVSTDYFLIKLIDLQPTKGFRNYLRIENRPDSMSALSI